MNKETRLILYALKWIIERNNFIEPLRSDMDLDVCNKIVDLVNPKEILLQDKTEETFGRGK